MKNVEVKIKDQLVSLQVDDSVGQEQVENLLHDMEELADSPQRKLTDAENMRYYNACRLATSKMPAFRDALALLRPFFDLTASTAYTDRFARVGLGPWFFFLGDRERATIVLHECMHVLNDHFNRTENLGLKRPKLSNLAGDFEINCGLALVDTLDVSSGVMPNKEPFDFPLYKTMEQYYMLLSEWAKKEAEKQCQCDDSDENAEDSGSSSADDSSSDSSSSDSDNSENGEGQQSDSDNGSSDQSQSSDQNGQQQNNTCPKCGKPKSSSGDTQGDSIPSGVGTPCDEVTADREQGADAAGIERASDAETSIAKKNTAVRIIEETKNKGSLTPGVDPYYDMLMLAYRHMTPPKVSWKTILRLVIAANNDAISRGKSDYSYRKRNRRHHDSKFIFPAMVQYQPTLYFGIDTSGSMTTQDYLALLSEVEEVLKRAMRSKDSVKVFTVDVDIKDIKTVNNINQIELKGGGGTNMANAVEFVNNIPAKKRPDIFVLATDGGTDWVAYEEELRKSVRKYRHILLITDERGYSSVPESIHALCKVIDVSPNR